MPPDHVGEYLEERRYRGDSEEDSNVVRVWRQEIEECHRRSRPHPKAPWARKEIGNGATRSELWLFEDHSLPYFFQIIKLLTEKLRDWIIDKESDETPGSKRNEGEIDEGQFGVWDTGFGLENNSAHHHEEHEKNPEDNIPKILISNSYHKDLRPHPHYQNEDEGTCHHRYKTKQEAVKGLVEHLLQYTA